MSGLIRMGVLGGSFGQAFFWHEHPNSTVAAVAEMDETRRNALKEIYRCDTAYQTLEEMLKDSSVDAVAVFSGAPDHVKHAVMCMEAGKHVISAVPAATNLEDAECLLEAVQRTGMTYMMAETSYYYQAAISARKFYQEGEFGNIYYTEAEYHHAGLDVLYYDSEGRRTWRYGYPPMLYPTHCTAFLTGVTGERLVEVYCIGWANDAPALKDNVYNNPFGAQTALFKTDKGNAFRVAIYWYGAHQPGERAQWFGEKMSFFMAHPNGIGPVIVRAEEETYIDSDGYEKTLPKQENYSQPAWYETEMLPEPLRRGGGHDGSQPFLTHEFIDSLIKGRIPAIDVYEALSYTVPGIIAHQSSLEGGTLKKIPVYKRPGS